MDKLVYVAVAGYGKSNEALERLRYGTIVLSETLPSLSRCVYDVGDPMRYGGSPRNDRSYAPPPPADIPDPTPDLAVDMGPYPYVSVYPSSWSSSSSPSVGASWAGSIPS